MYQNLPIFDKNVNEYLENHNAPVKLIKKLFLLPLKELYHTLSANWVIRNSEFYQLCHRIPQLLTFLKNRRSGGGQNHIFAYGHRKRKQTVPRTNRALSSRSVSGVRIQASKRRRRSANHLKRIPFSLKIWIKIKSTLSIIKRNLCKNRILGQIYHKFWWILPTLGWIWWNNKKSHTCPDSWVGGAMGMAARVGPSGERAALRDASRSRACCWASLSLKMYLYKSLTCLSRAPPLGRYIHSSSNQQPSIPPSIHSLN